VSRDGDCGHKFQMIDPKRSGNTIMIDDIDTIFEDQDNHWGDGKAPDPAHPFDPSDADDCPARFFEPRGQTAAVDVLHGLEVAWDMYLLVFHLRGWDGDGDEVDVVVHSPDQTGYLYGFLQDPYIVVADDVVKDDKGKITAIIPEASVDVIGHEFTHGVDQHLADVPDLLTEGTADIFGVAARRYWNDGSKAHGFLARSTFIPSSDDFNDFTIGHQFATGDRSRLFRPSLLFSEKNHLSGLDEVGPDIDDVPDPHKSGQPLTRAFFFLSQGASAHVDWETQPDAHHTFASYTDRLLWGMPGLGIDRAAHIFFRAMFECAPDEYGEARACAKVKATHPDALEAVENAFAGINVGAKASSYPPPPVEHKESEHNDDRDHADHVTPSNPPAAPFEQVAKAHITGTFSSRQDEDWTQIDAKCGTKMGLAWDGQSAGEMELALFEKGNTHQLGDRRLKHKQIAFDPKTDAHATHSRSCAKHDTITFFVKATATGPVKTDKRYSWRIDLY
jgi:hypothetical protein